jgi:hypothetical protein
VSHRSELIAEGALRRFTKAAINQYRPPFSTAITEKICNPALVPTSQSMQSADRRNGGHNTISAIPIETSTALAGLGEVMKHVVRVGRGSDYDPAKGKKR